MDRGPILFEQMRNVSEEHMTKTLGFVQCHFLDDYIRFGERDAAKLGCCVEGQDQGRITLRAASFFKLEDPVRLISLAERIQAH